MSAVKYGGPSYKLFEPEDHSQRPFIVGVDERPYSPETANRKYEEAVARQSGGDVPDGGSPTDLISMSAFAKPQPGQLPGFDSTRQYQDAAAYTQYPSQGYSAHPAQNADQISQESFATSTAVGAAAVGPYMAGIQPTILSSDPASGSFGTKVSVKVSFAFDVLSMDQQGPYFFILFGSQKCQAEVMSDSRDTGGFVCTISVHAPQHMMTGCQTGSVPLSLVVASASGEELAKVGFGQFLYHDAQVGHSHGQAPTASSASTSASTGAVPGGVGSVGGVVSVGNVGVGGAGASQDPITRSDEKSPVQHNAENIPKLPLTQIVHDSTTNTYDYPGPAQQQQPAQSPYATAFPQTAGNNTMITTYHRSASFADHYHRAAPPALRSPGGWSAFAPLDTSRSPALPHSSISRPNLNPLPLSGGPGAPQLIRTSTLQAAAGGNGYPYALYPNKAILNLQGSLDSMADNWSQEEISNRRRIVLFKRSQTGSTLSVHFRPVKVNERPPQSICISCIWWREKGECYVTSVDTILLLEQLLVAPGRFTVEEKNRIRRNLEGFHPLTVSKTKHDSEDFFRLIMGFPNPKPRNIEKDVKVFPWKVLATALNKIIGKYSASPSSTLPPNHGLPPSSASYTPSSYPPSSYPPLPTPPLTSGPGLADPSTAYAVQPPSYHDSLSSPRSISGVAGSWVPHSAPPAQRTLSPALRTTSPQSSLRISTLPAVSAYESQSIAASTYGSSARHHTPISHQPSTTATPPRWETPATTYADYPSLHAHHSSGHQVYSSGTAYDGGPRA